MKRLRIVTIAVLIILTGGYAFAQDAESGSESAPDAAAPGGPAFGFDLVIGANTFEDDDGTTDAYQLLGLRPDLSIGRFGIGLDLSINYRFTGGDGDDFEVREEDWVPSDEVGFVELYLPKIRYVRYGQKGDPLFARLGSFSDSTIGNGFIVNNYSNELFLPELRIFGANLDLDGSLVGFPYVGIESLVGNVAALDVLATRLYIRPLASTDIPVIQRLQFGATFAADTQPFFHEEKDPNSLYSDAYAEAHAANPAIGPSPLDAPNDTVAMFGADFRLPILTSDILSLATFGDFVLQDGTNGAMLGTGGRAFGFLLYGAQVRYLGEDFIPSYFDGAYDLRRSERFLIYDDDSAETTPSTVGWLANLGFSLLADAIVFSTTLSGPFEVGDGLYPELLSSLTVQEGTVPGFAGLSLSAFYNKFDIREFEDLGEAENSLIGTRINIRSGPVIISLLYNLTYDPNSDGDPWTVTSGLESTISLQ